MNPLNPKKLLLTMRLKNCPPNNQDELENV
jgi:hypothetical protein